MKFEIDIAGNVTQAAAAGAAALRAEAAAATSAVEAMASFRGAEAALEGSTKAAQGLADILRQIASTKAAQAPAFSQSTDTDFKVSKWEKPPPNPNKASEATPTTPRAADAADEAGTKAAKAGNAGSSAFGGLAGQIGKATLGLLAYGAAMAGIHSLADLTRMAIGWRTMGQLQMLSWKATLDLRRAVAGVDAKPLLRAFTSLETNLSKTTVTGNALSGLLTRGFNAVFGTIERLEPLLSGAFQLGVLGALKLEGTFLDLRLATLPLTAALGPLGDAFGDLVSSIDTGGAAAEVWTDFLSDTANLAQSAATAVDALASAIRAVNKGTFSINAKQNLGMISGEEATRQRAAAGDSDANASPIGYEEALKRKAARAAAQDTGRDIGDGIVEGMTSSSAAVGGAGEQLGKTAVAGARRGADAHSPSRATERLGRDMDAGAVQGLDKDADKVDAAARRALVPDVDASGVGAGPKSGGAGAPGAQGGIQLGPVSISVTVDARGGRDGAGDDLRAKLLELAPDLVQEMLRILSLRTGLPVMGTT